MRRVIALLSLLLVLAPLSASAQLFEIPAPPMPEILKFSLSPITEDCTDKGGENEQCFYTVPWIGEYISQFYVFAVGVASILAVVVIMVAGFMWTTAGGNTSQVENAKGYIKGAVTGLVLMLGSYTLLYTINPKLVQFEGLRLPIVKRIDLTPFLNELANNGAVMRTCTVETLGGSENIMGGSTTGAQLQQAFNSAGKEFGISPIYLAAVAQAESSFRPGVQSPKGAFGIVQIMPGTASDIWNTSPIQRPQECSGINDPIRGSYTQTCKNWMASNPTEVIRMGAAYLGQINKKMTKCGFENNYTLVAAGYNAGPNKKGLCEGEIPSIIETVDYVKIIDRYIGNLCINSGGTPVTPAPPMTPAEEPLPLTPMAN